MIVKRQNKSYFGNLASPSHLDDVSELLGSQVLVKRFTTNAVVAQLIIVHSIELPFPVLVEAMVKAFTALI